MKISLTTVLSFISLAQNLVGVSAAYGDSVGTPFIYGTPLAGSETCAVISILMDESGSMSGEQTFMRNDAAPGIAQALTNEGIDNVFFCSYGYGTRTHGTNQLGHFHGCTEGGDDLTIMDWVTSGGFEDSFEMSNFATDHLPETINGKLLSASCSSLALNMILVTDEDSDHAPSVPSEAQVLAKLVDAGWKMNIIASLRFLNNALGVSAAPASGGSPPGTILYTADGSGSFAQTTVATSPPNTVTSGSGSSETDYPPLAFGTDGALWDLNKLRAGGLTADSFTAAFVTIKVKEIVEDTTPAASAMPSAIPSSQPSSVPSSEPSESPSEVPSEQPSAAFCGDYPCGPLSRNGHAEEKVNICHYSQTGNIGDGITLCIPKTAIAAHLREHDADICGPCYLYI